ncbi:hypothetical protein [Paenibacillus sp. FSL L8-0158]|uniref:phosphorylase family protein n=1 Tax=Paenibacillus sp. FSL L8-0158 TaxID=2954752 RepID=UPI0031591507
MRFSPELVINTGSAGGLDPALLAFATEALAETRIEGQIVNGLITTADSFISQAERAHFIRSQFAEAKVTDMEGAAVVQTAYQFGVPFLAAANSAAAVVALVAAYDRDKL